MLSALAVVPVLADEEEDQYLQIVQVIQQADSLVIKGKPDLALTRFKEAQAALQKFRRTHPDWNAKVVAYRLDYVAQKIRAVADTSGRTADDAAAKRSGANESVVAGVQVRLLDAGGEPRKVLRLHPAADGKQALTMKLQTSMTMKAGEVEIPAMKFPELVMPMTVEVQSITPAGDINYQAVVGEVSITEGSGGSPQLVETLKSTLTGLKGLSLTGTITSRGVKMAQEVKVPPGADAQIQQALDQMKQSFDAYSTPLPEQAVGSGARWEVKGPIQSQGMTVDQTAAYQLVSAEADQLTLKLTLSQTASNQKVQNPAMPGLKLDLLKLTGSGTGEIRSDLSRLIAPLSQLKFHSDMVMEMNPGGQKQQVAIALEVAMDLQAN